MSHKILVVDDSEFARLKVRRVLEAFGYEIVAEASTVEEALARIGECKPDLVTLDIIMEGMDGVDGVKVILSKYPDVRILVVSAMGQEAMMTRALANGALGFVVKPFKDSVLLEEVGRVLGSKKG